MIDPKAITTYAQYNEDLILQALLDGVDRGFYIDVGANYPVIDSVTKTFYDKGWNGINIEPVKSLYQELVNQRKRDINIQCGAGNKKGKLSLREYVDIPGHSTFSKEQRANHGDSLKYKDYEVETKPLKDILRENNVEHINFLKIDVEGYEYEVIEGNDWKMYRPEILCIEANHLDKDWRPILKSNSYTLFISDGLNEYYIAKEAFHRTSGFDERIINLDYHALKQHQRQSWSKDSKDLQKLLIIADNQQQQIDQLNHTLSRVSVLSLHNQSLWVRIKKSCYGLTIDWFKFKYRAQKSKK